MTFQKIVTSTLKKSSDIKLALISQTEQIVEAAVLIIECFKEGNKLYLFGNGGSASDAQHIAGELIGRFNRDRRSLPAIALNTDTAVLTATSNDFGYDQVFSRQVEALVGEGDVVIAISTSGTSNNILKAVEN